MTTFRPAPAATPVASPAPSPAPPSGPSAPGGPERWLTGSTPGTARGLLAALLVATAWSARPVGAQEAHRALLREKAGAEIAALAAAFDGVAGVQLLDLTTGDALGVHQDLPFPQGSAIKIPILLELFRRAEAEPGLLARRIPLRAADQVAGTGVLRWLTDGGSELSLEDLAVLMIVLSDNTATNVLIDALGMDPVNRLMAELGAPGTRLRRKMIRPDASARGEENVSTAAEAARLMERLHRCDLPLDAGACARIAEILRIPKEHAVRRPLPGNVAVAFKPGNVEGVATVWALVDLPDRPYALAVMTNYGGDGDAFIEAVSDAAWRYFSRLARATDHGVRVPLDVIRRPPGGD